MGRRIGLGTAIRRRALMGWMIILKLLIQIHFNQREIILPFGGWAYMTGNVLSIVGKADFGGLGIQYRLFGGLDITTNQMDINMIAEG